jgi:hypothetical protein
MSHSPENIMALFCLNLFLPACIRIPERFATAFLHQALCLPGKLQIPVGGKSAFN